MKYKTKRKFKKVLSIIGWTITWSVLIAATAVSCHAWFLELSK